MKKSNLIYSMALMFAVTATRLNAQVPLVEKSYEVSGRAKRGFLDKIEMNPEKGTIDMVYVLNNPGTTKEQIFNNITTVGLSGKAKYEIYSYDKDLNLLGTSREEERVYAERWKDYSYTSVEYTPAIFGPSFSKVEVSAKYNWFSGYKKRTKTLEKIKLREEFDGKYVYTGNGAFDVPSDHTMLAICGVKTKKAWTQFNKMDILRCDKDMNISVVDSIRFPYPNLICYSAPLSDNRSQTEFELTRDWAVVFTPMEGNKTLPGDPKPNNFTYMRISPNGKIVEQIQFESPANGWFIEGAYEENGSVYLYGAGVSNEPSKKYAQAAAGNKYLGDIQLTHYQVAKFSGGKAAFVNCVPFTDIKAKLAKPAGQKKAPELDGKQMTTTDFAFTKTGDILITYQDWENASAPSKQGGTYKKYNGVFLFQLDNAGKLKHSYAVEINADPEDVEKFTTDARSIPEKNYFLPSPDGSTIYWLIRSSKKAAFIGSADADHNTIQAKPMNGIDYGSINLESGAISEFKVLGYDKKNPFYLFSNTSAYQMGNYVYFFSETEKGDKMLLSRIDISK